MAHPEGFEPPTKWFEATYSIQLSYGCVTAGRQFNVFIIKFYFKTSNALNIVIYFELRPIDQHRQGILFALLCLAKFQPIHYSTV